MKFRHIILGLLAFWAGIAHCEPPNILLSGTMDAQNERVAYVDGAIYKLHDEIAGYRIIRIDEYGMAVQKEETSEAYYIGIGDASNVSELDEPEPAPEPVIPATTVVSAPPTPHPSDTTESVNTTESTYDFIKWILSITLFIIGAIIAFIGGIWFLVEAFRTSIWWGLGCLFISIVELIFLIVHWDRASKPFWLSLIGGLIMLAAAFAAPGSLEFSQ